MWLFGRKKKESNSVNITGEQLFILLEKKIGDVTKRVNEKTYIVEDEILLDYKNRVLVAGIKYDKKRAKKEDKTQFDEKLMSVFLDDSVVKTEFSTLEEFRENAKINGVLIKNIGAEFGVFPEDAEKLNS
jgi:hypothetical protein